MKRCRFCDQKAITKYELSDGCICFPEDKEQYLCLQHESRAIPLGDMILLEEFK
jgi:hypothetical protein